MEGRYHFKINPNSCCFVTVINQGVLSIHLSFSKRGIEQLQKLSQEIWFFRFFASARMRPNVIPIGKTHQLNEDSATPGMDSLRTLYSNVFRYPGHMHLGYASDSWLPGSDNSCRNDRTQVGVTN